MPKIDLRLPVKGLIVKQLRRRGYKGRRVVEVLDDILFEFYDLIAQDIACLLYTSPSPRD